MAYETGPRMHRTGNALNHGRRPANGPPDAESTPLRGGANSPPNYASTDQPYGRFWGWTGRSTRGRPHHGSTSDDLPPYSEHANNPEVRNERPSRPPRNPVSESTHSPAKDGGERKSTKFGILAFAFILGGLIAWVAQDMWAMSTLSPSATERRKIVWDREYAKHQNQVIVMQDITSKWATETQQHNVERQDMSAEREALRKERAEWKAEAQERERLEMEAKKLELEKRRRELEREEEEEARKKAGLRWQDPRPDEHCLRYGTRRYTSRLENMPEGYSKFKACHETKAWINGKLLPPFQCDDQGVWGGVVGTWIIDFEEGKCNTFWQDFKDKGCTTQGSGMRRIESHLENLSAGDDGTKMCTSTPAEFHGLRFDGAHACIHTVLAGVWGVWFIEDGSCK